MPDKSGELPTEEGPQYFIDDLKKQLTKRRSYQFAEGAVGDSAVDE